MKSNTLKILIIIVFLIFLVSTNVYADNTYTANLILTSSKTNIKPGESITYEVKVEDINAGTGIKSVDFYVDYDVDSFDCEIEPDDNRNWSVVGFTNRYLQLERSDLIVSNTDQVIAKIVFTAKKGINVKKYPISLKYILFATETETFEIADKSININVVSIQTEGTDTTNEDNTSVGEDKAGEEKNNSGTDTVNEEKNNSGTNMTNGESILGNNSLDGIISNGSTNGNLEETDISIDNITSNGNKETSLETSKIIKTKKSTTDSEKNKSSNYIKRLPYSGERESIAIILGIIIMVIVSIWYYIRYKKINI